MRVIILVNILYSYIYIYIYIISLAPLVEKQPDLSDVKKKTFVSRLFGSTVFAGFYFI